MRWIAYLGVLGAVLALLYPVAIGQGRELAKQLKKATLLAVEDETDSTPTDDS